MVEIKNKLHQWSTVSQNFGKINIVLLYCSVQSDVVIASAAVPYNLVNAISSSSEWSKYFCKCWSQICSAVQSLSIAAWPQPLTSMLENLTSSSPKCNKYLCKFWFESLRLFTSYWVHKIYLETLFVNVHSSEECFIEISPLHYTEIRVIRRTTAGRHAWRHIAYGLESSMTDEKIFSARCCRGLHFDGRTFSLKTNI